MFSHSIDLGVGAPAMKSNTESEIIPSRLKCCSFGTPALSYVVCTASTSVICDSSWVYDLEHLQILPTLH